ncbi:MAG: translocation/assembly module TamB, partial [Bacteroidales bacterium]|nr:translocation/assembly module TamB [Bacteroidales bacterium]
EIIYNGKKTKNLSLETYTHEDEFYVSANADKVLLSDSVFMDSLITTFRARNDSVIYAINWQNDNKDVQNYGDFDGYLSISSPQKMELKFDHGTLAINDTLWWIKESNLLRIDSSELDFHEVTLYNEAQAIKVNGKITENITDTLHIGFSNFNLAGLRPILRRIKIDADGQINGEIKVIDYYNSPSFLSDLTISDFYFNKEKLGEAKLQSTWDPNNDAFKILGEIIYTGNIGKSKTLEVKGTYYPYRSDDNYDIGFKLNNYKLNTLQPFLKSFSSQLEGMASGEAKLSGSKEKPQLLGEINLLRTQLKIDYLNVSYSLADKVYLDDNVIYFDDITIYDSLNNTAKASGKLYHDNLRDFKLDLEFDVNNLVGLHTTRAQNEMFYGSALATGRVNLYGPLNNLNLDIIARTEKGTNVKIPVSYGTEVTENDYIVFVNNNTDSLINTADYNVEMNGISLYLDLNITNDADIQMFLPYNMGNIKSRGKGDIKMAIDPGGDFTMEGDYIINRGSFFLTLQSILNRNFEIRRGSKIMWTGDPYNAQINLKAVYKVKTKLGQFAPEQDSATRVPVDCVISLSNRLLNPEIKFTVEFPDLKDDTKQFIYARLDTNDQAMMSQQMISLLVLNSFTDPSGTSGSVGFNTFSLLTNQLNNWLSGISNDFDIGIDYRPGDELTAQEVEVALSTQLFDDRVLVDGNVGMRENEQTQKTNDIVGEVTVEVKITKDGRFRAKAFNKSNNNYLYRSYAPYTQGVGVFYTQEFNRLRDLFKKKNKKEKEEKNKDPEEQSMLDQ